MRLKSLLAALAAFGLAGTAPAADDTYDLRGPAPVKGAKYEAKMLFAMKDADATVKVAGQTIEFKQSITSNSTEQVKFLAVEGRQVTKSETHILKDQTETVVTIGGDDKSEKKAGDLEGEVIVNEREAESKWKNTLVDTKPNDKQKKKLAKLNGPENDDDMFPAGKVKVGHTWTTPATALRKSFGNSFTDLKGKLEQKFVRVEKVDGEECAVIEATGKVTGKLDGDEGEDEKAAAKLDMELDMKTVTYRSIKTGLDVKGTFTGKMKISGKQSIQGMDAEITVEGPISGETTSSEVKK